MTEQFPRLSLDAPIVQRLLPRLSDIAEIAMSDTVASVPAYAHIPPEILAEEILPVVMQVCAGFVKSFITEGAIDPVDVEAVVEYSTRRAEELIPFETLASALFSGTRRIWRIVAASAQPEDTADLAAFGDQLIEYIQLLSTAMTQTYVDVQETIFGPANEARRRLAVALLCGDDVSDLPSNAGIMLHERYRVLALSTTTKPSTAADAVETVLTRRRVRDAQRIAENYARVPVLTTFDGHSGVLLLPIAPDDHPDNGTDMLVDGIAKLLNDNVFAGESEPAVISALPTAAVEAAEVAALARQLGRPAGLYRIDDMLLEYQVTRPGTARDKISRRLEPLREQSHLLDALRSHIRHGLDRKSAADELHIHPNTFSYRLRRVADLTGIDPTEPSGSRLLAAALTIAHAFPDR
ncbi:helix-turn-helix domain-containing protein [Antrihabitans sp. YC3-6]|uniref:Helix-turn-helix domain-containing protein n=1 Tax=Antrihabitans stalagmiti TaxID=2799499 RepID=A0A934NPP9_9NOCA|nr:helix-turn-helix domain-containing protein [Antrihabitans stalagmiti]MBJ8339064.1 helix-turn-helix domain-containing protein [Antrihabitans stalagmiti]